MLTIVRNSWFSWDASVSDGSQPLAEITVSRWRERGELKVEGGTYLARREGRVSGDYLLESGGTTVARASKSGAFRRTFTISHEGQRYAFTKRSVLGRTLVLRRGDRDVGTVARSAPFSRQATADLPADLPLPLQAFIIWLAIVSWRRTARAAAA